MTHLLGVAGRTFLRTSLVAFLAFAPGLLNAPDYAQAVAIATAASIAALDAGFRALRYLVPALSEAMTDKLGVPKAFTEVVFTAVQTVLAGFITLTLTVLAAPDMDAARAAGVAGLLAIGTALARLLQGFLTNGEVPAPDVGLPGPGVDPPA